MINVKVKEFNIELDKKNIKFRLDFNALMKFEERYKEKAIAIFNEYLRGQNTYSNIVKILACCANKELSEQELASQLPFNFETMKLFDEIARELAKGLISESKNEGGSKNEQTNQDANI